MRLLPALGFVAGLPAVRTDAACITEPIMGGADPAVIYTNGFFYSLRTTGGDVRIRCSPPPRFAPAPTFSPPKFTRFYLTAATSVSTPR